MITEKLNKHELIERHLKRRLTTSGLYLRGFHLSLMRKMVSWRKTVSNENLSVQPGSCNLVCPMLYRPWPLAII